MGSLLLNGLDQYRPISFMQAGSAGRSCFAGGWAGGSLLPSYRSLSVAFGFVSPVWMRPPCRPHTSCCPLGRQLQMHWGVWTAEQGMWSRPLRPLSHPCQVAQSRLHPLPPHARFHFKELLEKWRYIRGLSFHHVRPALCGSRLMGASCSWWGGS